QRAWVSDYFAREVMPVLTPTAVDPAHPFPLTINKGLAFIVQVRGQDAFGRRGGVAIVLAPRALPRTIKLPDGVAEGPWDFVLLSSVIHANIESLFPGMKVRACHQFRVTRNSDLWVDEEEIDDLLSAIAGELPRRNYGDAVRLEVDDTCPRELVDFLLDRLDLEEEDLYQVDGPVNLHRVAALYDLVDEPSLKYRPFIPSQPRRLLTADPDLFATLRKGDVLLHHPYQSFGPVLELLRQAAMDPAVLAIKMTLYRTGAQSPVAAVLLDAALRGKEVTVVVELRARFDEKANIDLATRMKEAGAHVLYGIVGWKTHAKMLLIVRREANGLRRYVHVGTGNYHARTALAYTDLGLLSARQDLGEDVHDLFMQLTGFGRATPLAKLIAAPFTMIDELVRFIDAEADAARAGKKSGIIAKMNSLSEPTVIRALYRASQAGVPIELVVRGICALRPKVPGVSETIRVRSIVGRFLEHSRVFWFHHGGAEKVLIGSADWMPRNLYRRVECLVPVEAAALARRVVDEALTPYLTDDRDSWELGPDGTYTPSPPGGTRSAQQALLAELTREHEGF
ncbi:MAG: polyphosphate kinase 1, partial [Myxococcales bacterium]|nr:polyphosphate kinase 1 [Myxococcales bacterium]